jgi:hypothetical protein
MNNINFNDFEKLGISLTIGENTYYIRGIPYPIEKDIYKRIPEYNDVFKNLFAVKDEQLETIKEWIIGILNYKKNGNNVNESLFDEMGLTEVITAFVAIINFVTKRITSMQSVFGEEKKNIEIIEEKQK